MTDRRNFIGGAMAFAAAGVTSDGWASAKGPDRAMLLHLGTNMWSDIPVASWGPFKSREDLDLVCAADHLRCDREVWRRVTGRMAERRINMLVIDLGEALVYPSHPELAVKGSLTPDEMRAELARLRGLGIEPIPKLNFSTAHDTWLKSYERMVSTPKYYQVCGDVIRDVVEIFGRPRYFHLGYDEETAAHQSQYGFVCVRQGELWWSDFLRLVAEVERAGSRPWIWSDYIWHHKAEFLRRMPKSVLQSNWYYGETLNPSEQPPEGLECDRVQAYLELDKAGFDQFPCASNYRFDKSMSATADFVRRRLSPERVKGLLMAPWFFSNVRFEHKLLAACDQLADA